MPKNSFVLHKDMEVKSISEIPAQLPKQVAFKNNVIGRTTYCISSTIPA
jgi:hypothetical protein